MDLLLTRLKFILRRYAVLSAEQIMDRLKKTFHEAFRARMCRCSGGCEGCSSAPNCPYRRVFGQVLAPDPDALKRHQKPPLPFVFELRQDPVRLNNGDFLDLGLTLAGSAANHVPEFCASLIDVFRSFPELSLAGIDSIDCSGFSNPVLTVDGRLSFGSLATMSAEDILAVSALSPDQVSLNFLTPLRIMQDGAAIREFSFSKFVTSLFRRTSSLAYYYGGSALELDYKRLSALSKEMKVVGSDIRYSGKTGWKKEGLVGSCMVTGDLSEFHPVLLLGEYLHCGKGAAYGMGSYEIVRPDIKA